MLVVLLNGTIHYVDGDVRVIALLLLAASAHEVEVGAAVASARHDGEAMFAASAPYQAFQVVWVLPLAGAATGVRIEYALYTIKQCCAYKRLMTALVLNAFINQFANVVAVTEHTPQCLLTDWLVSARSLESCVSHYFMQAIERVFAGAE